MKSSIDQAWELAKQRFAAVAWTLKPRLAQWKPCQCRCTAGKEDDVAGFENPEGSLTAAFRPPATTRAKHATPKSCGPIWNRLWR
ncbi:L-rhamnose isomerase [Serratia fonticola]|uniref:L-rhamnose isomerase n=1 Tax=Serratia fonticola TaxID=47917 RepID=A0A4U9TGR6_SERFO|nr:L-rhamnose isomerase [Serratia fonticola]